MKTKARNLKGRSWELDLQPCAVLVGDNAAGKTAVFTGIRLALAGCLPPPVGLAKPNVWAAIAGDPEHDGELFAEVERGQFHARYELTRKAGRVSGEHECDRAIAMPEMLMDPSAFFRLTAGERLAAILRVTKVAVVGRASISDAIAETTGTPVAVRESWKAEAFGLLERVDQSAPLDFPGTFLTKAKAELKEAKGRAKTKAERLRSLVSGIPSSAPRDASGDIKTLKAAQAGLNGQLDDVMPKVRAGQQRAEVAGRLKGLEEEIAGVEATLAKLRGVKHAKPTGDPERLAAAAGQAERRLTEAEEINRDVSNRVSIIAETRGLLQGGCCPLCKTALPGGIREAQAMLDARIAEERSRTVPETKVGLLRRAAEDATRKVNEAYSERASWDAATEEQAQNIADLEESLAGLKSQAASERASLSTMPDDPVPDVSAIRARLEEIYVELHKAEAAQRDREAYAGQVAGRDRAEEEAAAATATADFWDDLIERVAERLDAETSRAFDALLHKTRAITDDLLNSPLVFRSGELGRYVTEADRESGCRAPLGSWISHEAFSGTEELIAYAAFAVALTDGAPFRIVLMDELGRIASERRRKLVGRMAELVRDGTLHQFIGIDTHAGSYSDMPVQRVAIGDKEGGAL